MLGQNAELLEQKLCSIIQLGPICGLLKAILNKEVQSAYYKATSQSQKELPSRTVGLPKSCQGFNLFSKGWRTITKNVWRVSRSSQCWQLTNDPIEPKCIYPSQICHKGFNKIQPEGIMTMAAIIKEAYCSRQNSQLWRNFWYSCIEIQVSFEMERKQRQLIFV